MGRELRCMSQTTMTIRIDDGLKRDFDKVCADLGMPMSTAINIFAKKVVREKRIPFEVSVDPFYSETNIKALKKSIEQIKSGKTVEMSLDDLEG